MKKLLALVLALVMVMGLSVVSTNAATYSDASDIQYEEAVAVMSAIGVLQGDGGKFNPKGTLTREQGAKILSYMLLGGKDAGDTLTASSAPFTDVAADRWSAGAIQYCKNAKILDGVGGGKFDPESPLSGYAFGKMLLTALGYDAKREGLTGGDWQLNVARLINKIDLANGLGGLNYSAPLTRDAAAKLSYNTLTRDMVEYVGGTTVSTNDGTTVDISAPATYVKGTAYSYKTAGAGPNWTASANEPGGQNNAKMQFCENYFPTLKMESTVDDFGVPMSKWYTGSNRTDYIRDAKKTIASEESDTLLATFTTATTPKKIRAAITASSADQLVGTDTKGFTDNDDLQVFVDGKFQATKTTKNNWVGTGTTEIAQTGNGVITRVYRNSETRDVTIVINGVYLAKVLANYNTKDEELAIQVNAGNNGFSGATATTNAWPTKISSDDFDGLENYKKDDLLLVTATTDGTDWTIQTVEPATNVVTNATVTAYRNGAGRGAAGNISKTDNATVTAGGTVYNYNRSFEKGYDLRNNGYSINDGKYNFYLDNNGFIIGAEEVEATFKAEDYLFVRNVNVAGWEAKAKVTFMDGTEATINVAKVTDNGTDYKPGVTASAATPELIAGVAGANQLNFAANNFYKFSKKSSGEYNLTTVAAVTTTAGTPVTIGAHAGVVAQSSVADGYMKSGIINPVWDDTNDNIVPATANAKTVAVADGKVYTGVTNMPKVSDTQANVAETVPVYYLLDENNNLIAIYTAKAGTSSSDKTKYAFLWADKTTGKNGDDTIYTYNAIVDGELTTITSEDAIAAAYAGTGTYGLYDISTTSSSDLVKLTGNDKNTVTGLVAAYGAGVNGLNGANNMFEVDNGNLLVNGAAVAVVTDNTKYYSINATKATANVEEIGDGAVLTLDTSGTKAWSYYVFKADDSAKTASMVYFVRTDINTAPSIATTTANVAVASLAAGPSFTVNLGAGTLAATNVTSVLYKSDTANDASVTSVTVTPTLVGTTLTLASVTPNAGSLAANDTITFTVTFNDSAATAVDVTVTVTA